MIIPNLNDLGLDFQDNLAVVPFNLDVPHIKEVWRHEGKKNLVIVNVKRIWKETICKEDIKCGLPIDDSL